RKAAAFITLWIFRMPIPPGPSATLSSGVRTDCSLQGFSHVEPRSSHHSLPPPQDVRLWLDCDYRRLDDFFPVLSLFLHAGSLRLPPDSESPSGFRLGILVQRILVRRRSGRPALREFFRPALWHGHHGPDADGGQFHDPRLAPAADDRDHELRHVPLLARLGSLDDRGRA